MTILALVAFPIRSAVPSSWSLRALTTPESSTAGDPSSSFERYGLRLVEEQLPTWMGKYETVRVTPLLPVSPRSTADRLIALGCAALLLAYVAGIGSGLCWALWWLVGA